MTERVFQTKLSHIYFGVEKDLIRDVQRFFTALHEGRLVANGVRSRGSIKVTLRELSQDLHKGHFSMMNFNRLLYFLGLQRESELEVIMEDFNTIDSFKREVLRRIDELFLEYGDRYYPKCESMDDLENKRWIHEI